MRIYPLTFLPLLVACASKRYVRSEIEKETLSIRTEHKEKISTQVLHFRKDSSDHEHIIEIFPNGQFTYAPETGFVGAAHWLRMIDKSTYSSKEGSTATTIKTSTLTTNEERSKNSKIKQTVANRTTLVYAAIIAIAILAVYLWWKLR